MSNLKYREELDLIENYKPAKSLEAVNRELGLTEIIKLASNENRLGSSELAKEAVKNFVNELSFYPDFDVTLLRERLSKDLKVNGDQLIFGNGSFELLSLIAKAFINKGEESIIPEITFGGINQLPFKWEGRLSGFHLKNIK